VSYDPTILPPNLPVPEDDGAADHLRGAQMPPIALPSTDGGSMRVDVVPEPPIPMLIEPFVTLDNRLHQPWYPSDAPQITSYWAAKGLNQRRACGGLPLIGPSCAAQIITSTATGSFGALLYEMLTGKTAFSGKSRASLIAAILTAEPPPIATLQPMTPPNLERVVKKCLAKDPEDRWQTASDLAGELRWISEPTSQPAVATAPKQTHWKREVWLLAGAAIAIVAAAVGWFKTGNDRAPTLLFQAAIPFAVNEVAVSPNGESAALVAYSESTNNYVLWLYRIGGQQPKAIEGTQGASYPFWSPDGNAIGFFADGKLKKVDIEKGQVQVICEAPNGRGGAWNQDGVIVFSPDID